MEQQVLSPNELRIIVTVAGAIVLVLIYLFGRPRRPEQGKRTGGQSTAAERIEPQLGNPDAVSGEEELDVDMHGELDRFGHAIAAERVTAPPRLPLGARREQPIERIVTLYVSARPEQMFRGSDLVVALEKCGLEFGDFGIFHRLVDGKIDAGPVFSVANLVKPGHFDMSNIHRLDTPGLSFFMALPGPLSALDAWDTMLPTAQRLAELLDGIVLDEQRNALGRQRVAHIRDELRAWDRKQEGNRIRPGW